MISVKITQEGEPNSSGKPWSYQVNHFEQRAGDRYTARARYLETHYLLEEKFGSASQEPFHLFGIEDVDNYKQADTRLYDRARARATEVMNSLVPKLEDETSHSVKNQGGKK